VINIFAAQLHVKIGVCKLHTELGSLHERKNGRGTPKCDSKAEVRLWWRIKTRNTNGREMLKCGFKAEMRLW